MAVPVFGRAGVNRARARRDCGGRVRGRLLVGAPSRRIVAVGVL